MYLKRTLSMKCMTLLMVEKTINIEDSKSGSVLQIANIIDKTEILMIIKRTIIDKTAKIENT